MYYATQNGLQPIDLNSLQERKDLRKKLQCKSFDWYIKNIIPDVPVPSETAILFGQLRHYWSDYEHCLAVRKNKGQIHTDPCNNQFISEQYYQIHTDGRFTFEKNCFTVNNETALILETDCSQNRHRSWKYDDYMIEYIPQKLCMTFNPGSDKLFMAKCDYRDKAQKWSFLYSLDWKVGKLDINKVVQNHTTAPRNAVFFGKLMNRGSRNCIRAFDNGDFLIVKCFKQPRYEQILHIDNDGRFLFMNVCFSVDNNKHLVTYQLNFDETDKRCGKWYYNVTLQQIITADTKLCLKNVVAKNVKDSQVVVEPCAEKDIFQKWTFSRHIQDKTEL